MIDTGAGTVGVAATFKAGFKLHRKAQGFGLSHASKVRVRFPPQNFPISRRVGLEIRVHRTRRGGAINHDWLAVCEPLQCHDEPADLVTGQCGHQAWLPACVASFKLSYFPNFESWPHIVKRRGFSATFRVIQRLFGNSIPRSHYKGATSMQTHPAVRVDASGGKGRVELATNGILQ